MTVATQELDALVRREHPNPATDEWLAITPVETLNLLASFQAAEVLVFAAYGDDEWKFGG